MSQKKDESYLDDLLKEVNNHPVNYDNYAKKSEQKSTSTDNKEVLDNPELLDEGLEETEDFSWDDISFDEEEMSFGDINFDDLQEEKNDDWNFEGTEGESLEPVVEAIEPETEVIEPEAEAIVKTPEMENEAEADEEKTPKAEDSLDNIVENLLDNLDDLGSLESTIPETEETNEKENVIEGMESDNMEDLDALMNSLTQKEVNETDSVENENSDIDDLLSLLSDTDFDAMSEGEGGEKESQDNNTDDIFSLDAMLSDMDELEDLTETDDSQEKLSDLTLDMGSEAVDLDNSLADLKEEQEPAKENKSKVSIFQKLFGNVHDEKAKNKQKEAIKKQEIKEKKKKPKKTKEELEEEKKLKAQEKKQKQDEAKKIKEAKKKEKEELKRKRKEEQTLEEEVDEGRINRVGATIVFVFFGLVAAGIILGGKGFFYHRSIAKATEYFGIQRYNEAYDEVRGVEIKEDDQEIYDKIIMVMYVNKQLNSYNNYYGLKMYPEALDSLLKGLKRYEEYISYAKELGIKSDMDYVKGQILGELKEMYQISEEEAYQIMEAGDQEEYSRLVIEKAEVE